MPSPTIAPPADAADPSPARPLQRAAAGHPAVIDRTVGIVRPWRRAGIVGATTWLAATTTFVLVTALSWMIREEPGPPLWRLYQFWDHWDTGHYMRISRVGYTPDRLDTHAFFPFYPMLLRGVDAVLPGPTLVATLVLANLCCLGALVVLHRFVASEFDGTVADRTLLYLMAFPTAFFLSAGYNESLFLLLSVSALYCLRSGRFWAAGALAGMASGTRLAGVLLAAPFVIEYARQRGWRLTWWRPRWWTASAGQPRLPGLRPGTVGPDVAALLLVPSGIVAFAVFCWVRFGDPLSFLHAQQGWGRHFAPPWETIGTALQIALGQPRLLYQASVHNLIDVGFALVAITLLTLCVVGPWRLRRDQLFMVVYAGVALMMILLGPNGGVFPMGSVPRYALELVPAFILLGRLGASRLFERLYLLPAIGLQSVFLLTFLNNVWIA